MKHSMCSNNNMNIRQWYTVNPPRGFIASYKSMTKSSHKTKIFKAYVERKLKTLYYHKVKRTDRERLLIKNKHARLTQIPLIYPEKGICKQYLQKYNIFFDTDAKDDVFEHLYHSQENEQKRRLKVSEYLQTIHSLEGCRIIENRCSIIITHVPRDETLLRTGKNAINDYKTIEQMLSKNKKSIRGKQRQGICSEYATVGAHSKRGSHGISNRFSDNVSLETMKHFSQIVKRIQYLGSKYLPVSIMKFIQFGRQMVQCDTKMPMVPNSVWSSAAMSYNYVSAAHVDDDCFLSAITVMVETTNPEYNLNSPVAVYFCLPECGKAIGLCPGDVIFFNPLYYHCISKRTKEYENTKVFVSSIYLQTAVVGGNDNRVNTNIETHVAE